MTVRDTTPFKTFDPNKPFVGAPFVYIGKPGLLLEAFKSDCATALAKAEMRMGVSLGQLDISFNAPRGCYVGEAKVTRVLQGRA